MPSAQERAKVLADEIKQTVREIKAAEVRVKHLSEQLMLALAEVRADAEVQKHAAGMYECGQCGVRTAVAQDTDELLACELCGADKLAPL
jgi:hypothetical protein